MTPAEMKKRLEELGELPVEPNEYPDVDVLLTHFSPANDDLETRFRLLMTKLCLLTVLDTTVYPGKLRFIIANCGTTPEMEKFLNSVEGVEVHPCQNSLGFSKNLLLSLSTAPVCAFMEDDALVKPDWLTESIKRLRRKTIVGMVGHGNKIAPWGGAWLMHRDSAIGVGGWRFDFTMPIRSVASEWKHGLIRQSLDGHRLDTNKDFAIRALERGFNFIRVPKGENHVIHALIGRREKNSKNCYAVCENFIGRSMESFGLQKLKEEVRHK